MDYAPHLDDGEYELRVFGKDASGNVVDSSGIEKSFIVQSDAKKHVPRESRIPRRGP